MALHALVPPRARERARRVPLHAQPLTRVTPEPDGAVGLLGALGQTLARLTREALVVALPRGVDALRRRTLSLLTAESLGTGRVRRHHLTLVVHARAGLAHAAAGAAAGAAVFVLAAGVAADLAGRAAWAALFTTQRRARRARVAFLSHWAHPLVATYEALSVPAHLPRGTGPVVALGRQTRVGVALAGEGAILSGGAMFVAPHFAEVESAALPIKAELLLLAVARVGWLHALLRAADLGWAATRLAHLRAHAHARPVRHLPALQARRGAVRVLGARLEALSPLAEVTGLLAECAAPVWDAADAARVHEVVAVGGVVDAGHVALDANLVDATGTGGL